MNDVFHGTHVVQTTVRVVESYAEIKHGFWERKFFEILDAGVVVVRLWLLVNDHASLVHGFVVRSYDVNLIYFHDDVTV